MGGIGKAKIDAALQVAESQVENAFEVPVKDYWDCVIDRKHVRQYAANHRPRFLKVIEWAVESVKPGARICEVGSGPGVTLLCLRELGFPVTGYDMHENIASYSKALQAADIPVHGWNLNTEARPATGGDERFDVVICSEVVEHLQVSLRTGVSRLTSLMAPNAVLVLTTPNSFRATNILKMLSGEGISDTFPDEAAVKDGVVVDGRVHPREATRKELVRAVRENNLEVMTSKTLTFGVRNPVKRFVAPIMPGVVGDYLFVKARSTRQ